MLRWVLLFDKLELHLTVEHGEREGESRGEEVVEKEATFRSSL